MTRFHTLEFGWRILLAVVAAVLLCAAAGAGNATVVAQGTTNLPIAPGTPLALVKSIVVANREVSETNELKTQATITRGTQNDRIVLPLFLYKDDLIETFEDTKVTVLFLDDPVPGRDNEVIIYPNSKVGIGSSDSWWGRAWAKVKDVFVSQTRYARLSARGTEYEVNVIKDQPRAVLTVIEGTVKVEEGKGMISAPGAGATPTPEVETMTTPSHQFLLANFIFPITQTQFGRELQVPAGKITSQIFVYNVHSECHQPHRYEFRTSDSTAWFSLLGEKNFVVGPQDTVRQERTVQIDATALAPALYQAHVYAICLDCRKEPGCSQAQLDWLYRITVSPLGPIDKPIPTLTPTPSQENNIFLVNERKQLPINRQNDRVIDAPASDLQFVLNWTSDVLVTTQPTYSAQNLIPHFTTLGEREQNFRTARERAVLSNKIGSHETLGDVYSDWGQPAWALYAYEKELSQGGVIVQPPNLSIDRGEALRLTGQLDEAGKVSNADANSPKAQNLFGNIALDRARIALNLGNGQEVDARVEEAKRSYASALSLPAVQMPAVSGNNAVQANIAEANIVAANAALQISSTAAAQARFGEAVGSLEKIQQGASIYPFPTTDLGVAYRGQGDAAVLSNNLKAAADLYEKAKRQHEQAINAHRDFAEAYFNMGDLYDDLGDRENAKAYYRQSIQARPDQPAAYYPLAMLLQDEDRNLAAALAAIYLKLEREVLLVGPKADNARRLANHETVGRPPRIGEKTKGGPGTTGGPTGGTGTGDKINVPPVVGKPVSQARSELENLGLRVTEKTKVDRTQPAEAVIEQDPKAPKQVKRGSTVKLLVSLGDLVEVPDVTKKDEGEARKKIAADNKVTVGNVDRQPDCKLVGKVIAQNPVHSKTLVPRGTAINLVIGSLGDNPVTIPPFSDRNSAEAFIRDNGLTLGNVSPEETDDYPEGTVLRQSPSAGKQYGRNCPVKVNLLVATPIIWVYTDNYVGHSEQQARQELGSIELYANVTYQESDEPPGTVLQQSPPPQTKVKHRSYVTLVVAVPPKVKLVPVPSVCGMTLDDARATLTQFGFVNGGNDFVYTSPPKLITCGKGAEGTVFMQDPMPNAKAQPGATVKLKLVNFNIPDN